MAANILVASKRDYSAAAILDIRKRLAWKRTDSSAAGRLSVPHPRRLQSTNWSDERRRGRAAHTGGGRRSPFAYWVMDTGRRHGSDAPPALDRFLTAGSVLGVRAGGCHGLGLGDVGPRRLVDRCPHLWTKANFDSRALVTQKKYLLATIEWITRLHQGFAAGTA